MQRQRQVTEYLAWKCLHLALADITCVSTQGQLLRFFDEGTRQFNDPGECRVLNAQLVVEDAHSDVGSASRRRGQKPPQEGA